MEHEIPIVLENVHEEIAGGHYTEKATAQKLLRT
jgi:hypothetical protein